MSLEAIGKGVAGNSKWPIDEEKQSHNGGPPHAGGADNLAIASLEREKLRTTYGRLRNGLNGLVEKFGGLVDQFGGLEEERIYHPKETDVHRTALRRLRALEQPLIKQVECMDEILRKLFVLRFGEPRLDPPQDCQGIALEHLLKASFPEGPNLEEQCSGLICIPVDLTTLHEDYLSSNELTPKNVKPHLDLATAGPIVSVGTRRSLSNLLLSNHLCTGLIVRDINPRVKAYIDFLVLLLRIAESREEGAALSASPDGEEAFEERIALIAAKVRDSDIPQWMQAYYLKNLQGFAKIYFETDHSPPGFDHTGVDYFGEDALFAKLQHFARAGRIIATIGNIGDLTFLDQQVAVLDTSNCFEHTLLDIRGKGAVHARVIWTTIDRFGVTAYYSYLHQGGLNAEERWELNRLFYQVGRRTNSGVFSSESIDACPSRSHSDWLNVALRIQDLQEMVYPRKIYARSVANCSREYLDALRKYIDQNFRVDRSYKGLAAYVAIHEVMLYQRRDRYARFRRGGD